MAKKLELKIDLNKVPKPARIAIAVVPAVLLIVVMVFVMIMPKNKDIDNLKKEIVEQEKQITKTQSMAGKLDDLKAENDKLKKMLKDLQENLPEEHEISALLKQVTDLALEAGLKILSWNPAQKRSHPSGIVYEVPVGISMTGSYHRLGRFFSSLTTLDRIINISNINLSRSGRIGKEVILGVSFSAVTFTAVAEEGLAK
jgi:type IV pilus assembly protein PilO